MSGECDVGLSVSTVLRFAVRLGGSPAGETLPGPCGEAYGSLHGISLGAVRVTCAAVWSEAPMHSVTDILEEYVYVLSRDVEVNYVVR